MKRILIVDDVTVNRYILKKYILRISDTYVIDEAINGEICLQMHKSCPYDIIFMDIKMPGMSGIECTKYIREKDKKVKIYGITGQVERDIVRDAIHNGMDMCIGKPLDIKSIRNIIQ